MERAFRTFAGEAGSITAQHSQGIMWWEGGFADGCDEGITGGHQAKTAAQRRHGQLCFQDVFCRSLISAEGMEQKKNIYTLTFTSERMKKDLAFYIFLSFFLPGI